MASCLLGRSEKKLRWKCPSCSDVFMRRKNTNPDSARSHGTLLSDTKELGATGDSFPASPSQDRRTKLYEKNKRLVVLGIELCSLRTSIYHEENKKNAAAEFLVMKSKQKQELDAINERMNELTKSNAKKLAKEREKNNSLQAEIRKFQEKCQHLEENNTQDASDETLMPELIELVEEKEFLQDTLKMLSDKERDMNDKFLRAMKAAKEVLQENTRPIGIKKVGRVDEEPWKKAFAKKFKDLKGDWELSCTETILRWNETYLRDSCWWPYKIVQTDTGKFEEQIDTNDEKLTKLNAEFGEEVWKTVVDALNELSEFNASGRYLIDVPWNFDQGRAARLDEIIDYLASDR